jgi:hypothetical protein
MIRIILATVVGIIVALLIVVCFEMIGHALWPATLHPDNAATLPIPLLLSVVLGWFLGVLGGSFVAGKIAHRRIAIILVGAVILAATLYNFWAIPHPLWMMISGVVAPILAVALAMRLVKPGGAIRQA